ncbi:LysR family transcriptional regulator [Lederbergia sp. NSJ-179]|uniref:LysR family transcriptional regulator n=1 Tax=Lederbergia sp. NSJ-179 TaxID=2931402 RepID=UPI001FD2418B|nr:LysR family transcriptional regulator [Lederbergia sp. NSJ-179]MCJ7841755.1 LysR family transcriptional regulator [Lederbergia sp. NSJ-179]
MDIHRMECFLSLAKCLNFTRAAEEQYVSQSTMTMHINKLEEELGVKLFIRDKRSVRLTEAGKSLETDFIKLLDNYKEAIWRAQHISSQVNSNLRVGYHGPVNWAYIPNIFRDFKKQYPYIHLEVNINGWGTLVSQILNNSLDVIFIEKSEVEHIPQLEIQQLFRDLVCVAVPDNSKLSLKNNVNPEQLYNENLIMTNNESAPICLKKISERLSIAGFDTKKIHYVSSYENALALVASGLGISFFPRSFKQADNPNIVFVDLNSENVYLDMCLVWLKNNDNSSIKLLSKMLENYKWK